MFWTTKKFYVFKVVLVDHNELDDKEKSMGLANLVTSIVDHHLDKNEFQQVNPRIIDTLAGSNATLISRLFYDSKVEIPESFATMLLFPILSGYIFVSSFISLVNIPSTLANKGNAFISKI